MIGASLLGTQKFSTRFVFSPRVCRCLYSSIFCALYVCAMIILVVQYTLDGSKREHRAHIPIHLYAVVDAINRTKGQNFVLDMQKV